MASLGWRLGVRTTWAVGQKATPALWPQLSLGQSLFSEDLQPPGLKWGTSVWAGRDLPCPWLVFLSAHAELPGGALGSPHECRTAACETLKSTD